MEENNSNEPERYFFYQDITRIRWNGDQSILAETDMGLKLVDRILDLDWSYQKTAICQ